MKNLLDINWLHMGRTDEYSELKTFVAHVCRDVTKAAQIDEICINDILQAFKQHGYIVVEDPAGREPLPVLMTRDNPDGFKLEELAEKLRCEIQAKTLNISGDPSIEAQTVVNNNAQIIGLLFQIEALQRQSFAVMAQIRPDGGPEGKPRIGEGS